MKRLSQTLQVVLLAFVLSMVLVTGRLQTVFADTENAAKRDPEWYNYIPIVMNPGLSLTTKDNLQDVIVANLVKDQGYEAYCAAPEWHMAPGIYGEWQKYFEDPNYKGIVYLRGYEDPYKVDLTDARIAMMRGDEETTATNKISSLEALVGVVNPNLPPEKTNSNGAIYNLLPPSEQCEIKMRNMTAMKQVCLMHLSASICALNMKIPKTDIKMGDLLHLLNEAKSKYEANSGGQETASFCRRFTGGYDEEYITNRMELEQDEYEDAYEALMNYSIDQEYLYRVGFLVISIRQNRDEGENDIFWLRKVPEDINATLDAPIVVAFKIPDFLTNKSLVLNDYGQGTGEEPDFIDGAKVLNNLKWDTKQLEKFDEDAFEKRKENLKLVAQKRGSFDIIKYCGLYPCRSDPEELLQRAVIDIINGIGTTCKEADMPWEDAGVIGAPANVTNDRRHVWPEYFDYMIPSERTFKFNWELEVNRDNPPNNVGGQTMRIQAHLVVPMGTDLRVAENTLKAIFQPGQYEKMAATNVLVDYENKLGLPDYYPIKNALYAFDTSTPTHKFKDYTAEPVCKTDKWGNEVCDYPTKQFGASITEEGKEILRIVGAKYGWMIRKIEEEFRQPHLQIECTRTEDLFLGRCKVADGDDETKKCDGEGFANIKDLPEASGIPTFAQDMYKTEIEPRLDDEKIEAYEYAEEQTGIPCEIVAGIHWTEAGLDGTRSVFDGGALRGGSLKEDAKLAMEHLKSKWPGAFNKDNIPYKDLTKAIADYNGPGNMNCSYDFENQPRPTRWRTGGKCEAQFYGEDHPHPLGWITERHNDMDLIYCLDFVEFNCSTDPNETAVAALRARLDAAQAQYGFSDERKEQLISDAILYCFAPSNMCQSLSEGRRYPKYDRPGSITTAILLNESGAAAQ